MDFLNGVVEDIKKSVQNLKSVEKESENIDVLISVIEDLARIKSLAVLDVWLEVLEEDINNKAVKKLYKKISHLRFVEMEDKSVLEIKNVFTNDNVLLYSGHDDVEAWKTVQRKKDTYPSLRVEYWRNGVLKETKKVGE